jgi:hypothetical protein
MTTVSRHGLINGSWVTTPEDQDPLPIPSQRSTVTKVSGIEEITKMPKDIVDIIVDYGFEIHYRRPFDATDWQTYYRVKVVDCALPEDYFKWALSANDTPEEGENGSPIIVTNEVRYHYPVLLPQRITELDQEDHEIVTRDYGIGTVISQLQKQRLEVYPVGAKIQFTAASIQKHFPDKASSNCWLVVSRHPTQDLTREDWEKGPIKDEDIPTVLDLETGLVLVSHFQDRPIKMSSNLSQKPSKNGVQYFQTMFGIDPKKNNPSKLGGMEINSRPLSICHPKQKLQCHNIKKFKADIVPNSTDKAQSDALSSFIAWIKHKIQ